MVLRISCFIDSRSAHRSSPSLVCRIPVLGRASRPNVRISCGRVRRPGGPARRVLRRRRDGSGRQLHAEFGGDHSSRKKTSTVPSDLMSQYIGCFGINPPGPTETSNISFSIRAKSFKLFLATSRNGIDATFGFM